MEHFPGVLLVFHNWNIADPLTEDMKPNEVIVTEASSSIIYGIRVGSRIEDCTETRVWSNIWYDVICGTANLKANYDGYSVLYVVSGEDLNLPAEDTAQEYDWDAWKAEYGKKPTGTILEIRIERTE